MGYCFVIPWSGPPAAWSYLLGAVMITVAAQVIMGIGNSLLTKITAPAFQVCESVCMTGALVQIHCHLSASAIMHNKYAYIGLLDGTSSWAAVVHCCDEWSVDTRRHRRFSGITVRVHR